MASNIQMKASPQINAKTQFENWRKNEKVFLQLNQGSKEYLLFANEILYIQADHVYVRIFTFDGKRILERSSLGKVLEKLPKSQFVQTHRSFVVNLNHIKFWDKHEVIIKGNSIPISRSRRRNVLSILKKQISNYC